MKCTFKKTVILLIIAIMCVVLIDSAVCLSSVEDNRTIRIYTKEDLSQIGTNMEYPLDGHYLLMNDLVFERNIFEKANFNQIGETAEEPFSGIFDGNGKTISGLVWKDEEAQVALFGYIIGENAIVKNLGLLDVDFLGYKVGAIANSLGKTTTDMGVIENCYATGILEARYSAGGIVMEVRNGVVKECHSTCEIISVNIAGGICATALEKGTISQCSYQGNITNLSNYFIGGIVGYNEGVVEKSYFKGKILIANSYYDKNLGDCMGGIAGFNVGTIEKSYFSGEITSILRSFSVHDIGENGIGGVTGQNWGMIRDCYSLGKISGEREVGGIVGVNWGSVLNCYSAAQVSQKTNYNRIGGVAGSSLGDLYAYTTVDKCVSMIPELEVERNGEFGRVIGQTWNEVNNHLINYSWRDMKLFYRVEIDDSDFYQENVKNGFFITTIALKDQLTYEGLGWNFNESDPVWEFSGEYMLPKLVGVGGQENLVTPSHLM